MTYTLFNTLCESRSFPSKKTLEHFSARELSDLAVLYFCAIYIMFCSHDTQSYASTYVKKTKNAGLDFDSWSSYGNDLYIIMYGLSTEDVSLDDQHASDAFKATLPIGHAVLNRWITDIATNKFSATHHRAFFTNMDFNFKIKNNSIRAIRRLVMDWTDLSTRERKLAVTRLLQLLRARLPKSEILPTFVSLARAHGYEIEDAGNADDHHSHADYSDHHEDKHKVGLGAKVAAGVAGFAGGALLTKTLLNLGDKKKR